MSKKIALVTGASSGIGAATALRLAAAGFIVYAAARRVERMAELATHGITVIGLDITSEDSITACLQTIRQEHGGIDVLVNNAGYGSYGAVEEIPMDDARRQFEVNLFGLARLTQQAIAHMRQQRWGRIINVSSIGGVGATPYGAWYHASKFALEGYSNALRQELEPFGVKVSVIRPGGTKTEWGGIAVESLLKVSGDGPYQKAVQAMAAMLKKSNDGSMLDAPEVIAKLILQAATAARPKTVYIPAGISKLFVLIPWLLSHRISDALTRAFLGLPKIMGLAEGGKR